MTTWHLRPSVADDFPRFAEIINLLNPHDTMTGEQLEQNDQRRDHSLPFRRLVAEDADGKVAGYGVAVIAPHHPPGVCSIVLRVDPDLAGHGVGTKLWNTLFPEAKSWGVKRIESFVRDNEPLALAFAERRGFARVHHYFDSELALANFDPAPFQAYVEHARSSGYEIVSMADLPGEENQRRLYELDIECSQDEPSNSSWQAPSFEAYEREFLHHPGWDPAGVYVAIKDGEWAGMTGIQYPPTTDRGWTFFTGVRRAHRGHGLAHALKVVGLTYAKQKGYARVGTANHSANPGMLAINVKLGFQRLPGTYAMRKLLADE